MPYRHALGLLMASALLGLPTTGAMAVPESRLSPSVSDLVARLPDARINAIRSAAASGELENLLAAVAETSSDRTTSTAIEAALPRGPALGLPPSLALPVADLAVSVHKATVAVRFALQQVPQKQIRAVLRRIARVSLPVPMAPHPGEPLAREASTLLAVRATGSSGIETAVANVLERIDLVAIRHAAVDLAATIDRSLPLLRTATVSAPPQAAACDVLDTAGICIGGDGPNRYTEDRPLVIDLGGDDVYENAAGGANAIDAGGLPVSVNIDVGGNDRYQRETLHTDVYHAGRYSQGTAFGGIGILVDAAGDDTYVHTPRPHPEVPPGAAVRADAQGNGQAGGVGMLADLGGDDAYTVDASASRPADSGDAYGQGLAILGGVGILLDAGAGSDTYRMDGGAAGLIEPAEGVFTGTIHSAQGQGLGVGAAPGVLVDEGGTDSFSMIARTDIPADRNTVGDFQDVFLPTGLAGVNGQALSSTGGEGLLLTGRGPTTYVASLEGTGLGIQGLFAQGVANLGGTALIDDLGGDDAYTLRANRRAEAPVAFDDECGCMRAEVNAFGPIQTTQGQGFATFYANLAAIHDHAGADRYLAVNTNEVIAVAEATGNEMKAEASAISFPGGRLLVQGGSTNGAEAGLLMDDSGDDSYVAEVTSPATARAISPAGGETDEWAIAAFEIPRGWLVAQGATGFESDAAALVDAGGTDSYRASATARAEAPATPDGAVEVGTMGFFQGSGPGGTLVDFDGGARDSFVSEPNFEDTCTGHRGEPAAWSECPVGGERPNTVGAIISGRPLGLGLVDSAPAKAPVSIAFEPSQPAAGKRFEVLPVQGRLVDGAGNPLAGRTVDVRTQRRFVDTFANTPTGLEYWIDLTAIHAVTDASGRWTARLRLPDIDPGNYQLRLWSGFSGDSALRGANASLPLTLE